MLENPNSHLPLILMRPKPTKKKKKKSMMQWPFLYKKPLCCSEFPVFFLATPSRQPYLFPSIFVRKLFPLTIFTVFKVGRT